MSKTTVEQLGEFGQSIWLDNISRSMIETRKLSEMIAAGLRGMTSNPTIFEKAISGSSDYDAKIRELYNAGKSSFEIYDELTIHDIQDAADLFRPLYDKTNGSDGYVSLEINPQLACDTTATIKEGKRLHKKVNRPNAMFKVPATNEGFGAIEALLGEGINVNVTLIFSLDQYSKAARAFLRGMRRLRDKGGELRKTFSVASFFVSRVDTAVDMMIDDRLEREKNKAVQEELVSLKGKAAVANAHLIYKEYLMNFSQEAFFSLEKDGAMVQKVLWGSTGTKNPAYSDIKYVTELIAKDTINTLPPHTFEAFRAHGVIKEALTADVREARDIMDSLKKFGIDIDIVCAQLLKDGASAFTKSFESLLNTIECKAKEMCGQ